MIDPALTFLTGAFTGILTAIILHFLATIRDKRNRFNDATNRFRDAFIHEREAIDPDSENDSDVSEILERAFSKHKTAVLEFRRFLEPREQRGFDLAWQEYGYRKQYPHIKDLIQYSGIGKSSTEIKKRRLLALQRIENLLKFTEPDKHYSAPLVRLYLKRTPECFKRFIECIKQGS